MTISKLSLAIRLALTSRQFRDEAFRLRNNPVGRRDRMRLADDYWTQVLWVLGRIGEQDYWAYLNGK